MEQVKNRLRNSWARNSAWGNPDAKRQKVEASKDEDSNEDDG